MFQSATPFTYQRLWFPVTEINIQQMWASFRSSECWPFHRCLVFYCPESCNLTPLSGFYFCYHILKNNVAMKNCLTEAEAGLLSLWSLFFLSFLKLFLFTYLFRLCGAACGILVPQPGIEPVPPAVEGWSPNLWTAREFSLKPFLIPSIHPTTDVLGSDPHYHVAVAVAQALLSVS